MQIDKKNMLIVIFISVLIVPSLLAFILQYEPDEDLENATIVEAPALEIDTLTTFPELFEAYYEDAIPFKEFWVSLGGYMDFYIFDKSGVNSVIKGEDGWLFFNKTVEDYEGTNSYSEEALLSIAENLTEVEEALNNQDIEFYVMIAPNKNSIYGEYMPSSYIATDISATSQLVSYLNENTDLKIVFPKEELEVYKDVILYHKWDTHWNELGAYIGFQALAESMGLENIEEYENLEVEEEECLTGDLKELLSIELLGNDISYSIQYKENISTYVVDNEGSSRIEYTSNSSNAEKILVFRDSFCTDMIPYITKEFEESVFLWKDFSWDDVVEYEPDIVVYELVERSVDRLEECILD